MWTDEDLDNLIKNDFPYFYDIYKGYDVNIKRIDMARYFILYKYGGIYADMDYICFKNFYNLMPQDKVSISESDWQENEYLQNALMISPKEHPFWLSVIKNATIRYNKNDNDNDNVLYNTGPILVSDTYYENTNLVNPLPQKIYCNNSETHDDSIIATHYGTFTWKEKK